MNISLKEFKQNTYKYLNPGTYILTNHDVATLKLVISSYVVTNTPFVATPIETDVATCDRT